VFLRVLDYYTGILFLTTNRAGSLDEAFKSRIHYKIYYPPLSKDQTLDIWRLNIQRLRHINQHSEEKRPLEIFDSTVLRFAEEQYEEGERRRAVQWNGRQIRNAFQVARSLAYYDANNEVDQNEDLGLDQPVRTAVLDVKYFLMMHEMTESFDHYMLEVFSGHNDKDLAFEMEQRADHWRGDVRYRSVQVREEHDDRYNDYNARPPLDIDPRQESLGRPRSTSHGNTPTLAVPGSSQRYSLTSPFSPPSAFTYEPTSIEEKGPGFATMTSPMLDQQGTSQAPREGFFPRSGSSPQPTHFPRTGGGYGFAGRGARRESEFSATQAYGTERNSFGKRDRL
jgi:hypothetical protein